VTVTLPYQRAWISSVTVRRRTLGTKAGRTAAGAGGRYRLRGLPPDGLEAAVGADSALHATVDRVMADTGPSHLSAVDS
jgi:hypothetical protein